MEQQERLARQELQVPREQPARREQLAQPERPDQLEPQEREQQVLPDRRELRARPVQLVPELPEQLVRSVQLELLDQMVRPVSPEQRARPEWELRAQLDRQDHKDLRERLAHQESERQELLARPALKVPLDQRAQRVQPALLELDCLEQMAQQELPARQD
jgi:hypothetical protein